MKYILQKKINFESLRKNCFMLGQLFSADDGWGSAKESWSHGRVRIKVWRVTNTHFVTAELSQDHHPDLLFHTAYDQSKDLLIAKVGSLDYVIQIPGMYEINHEYILRKQLNLCRFG